MPSTLVRQADWTTQTNSSNYCQQLGHSILWRHCLFIGHQQWVTSFPLIV